MAATVQFGIDQSIPEDSSYQYTATFLSPDGDEVTADQIDEILVTLRDVTSGSIVNGRDASSVLDPGGGGTFAVGLFTMQFDPEDMASIGTLKYQPRRLTIDVRLTGGGRITHEVDFYIQNLDDIS